MVTFVKGDIFKSAVQVLTNTVNCVGVMGKGVALEFKSRYPKMFGAYKAKCDQGKVRPGRPYLWEDDSVQILNFPTKRNWRDNSLLQDIEDEIKDLGALPDLDVYVYEPQNVDSIIGDDQDLESQTKTAKEKISARPRGL